MEDHTPPTEPSGGLVPPPKLPPTALALASPAPLPHRQPRHPQSFTDASALTRFVEETLDIVDEFADAVAEGLGLRPR